MPHIFPKRARPSRFCNDRRVDVGVIDDILGRRGSIVLCRPRSQGRRAETFSLLEGDPMGNPIIDAIEQRRTTVLFDTSHTIGDDEIRDLVAAATRAPTAFNLQNWRFIAVRSPEAKARLRKVAWDQAKITEAAVTFIVCGQIADHTKLPGRLAPAVEAGIMPETMVPAWEGGAKSLYFEQPQRSRDEAVRTATFGAMTLILAAHSIGLGSGPMIGFDPEAVSREFGLAEDEIPVVLISVGRGTSQNWPQKPRRPLSEVLAIV